MLFFSLVILLFASDASCETLFIIYSSKLFVELPCPITDQTVTAAWNDETTKTALASYEKNESGIKLTINSPTKHNNFMFDYNATSLNLAIQNVEAEDGGEYACTSVGEGTTTHYYTVAVEVLVKPTVQYESPDVDVLDGIVGTSYEHFHVLAKPTVMNGSQDVDALNVIAGTSYDLTCSATRARSESDLSLVWDPSLVVKTPLVITPNGNYRDYNITSTYTAVRGDSNITCKLTGYVMQDEINDQRMEHISHTVNLNVQYAPMCNITLLEGEDCREVTLTCECVAVPAGITQYSFFNGSNNINNGTSKTFTVLVAYGTSTEFSCSATNDIGPGDQTDAKDHDCGIPVESGGLTTGAIVGTIVAVIVVVIVVVVFLVIAKMKWKPGNEPGIEKHEMQDPTTDGAEQPEVTHIGTDEQGDEGALPTQPLNTRKSVDGGHLN